MNVSMNKARVYLILVSISFLVYANTLGNGFISDDFSIILKNPLIDQPWRLWLSPAELLSSLCFLISGFNPLPYHLASVTLHTINTILVFFFLRLFFKIEPSFLGCLIFAVHPVHTEAVSWISGRLYLVLTLFTLATYLLYSRATGALTRGKSISSFWYVLCMASFLYCIWAGHPLMLFFPLLLILSDVTFGRWRKNWVWWIPFVVIVSARLLVIHAAISERFSFMHVATAGLYLPKDPILYFVYSLYAHAKPLLWPVRLDFLHDPEIVPRFLLTYSIVFFISIIALLVFFFKKAKAVFFGLGIFILFLLPTYSPIPLSSPIAERYIYLPSIALSVIIAYLYERYSTDTFAKLKKPLLVIVALIIMVMAIRTVVRNEDWKDSETFWKQAVLISPKSWKAHYNLGLAYTDKGNIQRAIGEYTKALEINPRFADTYNNLGVSFAALGLQDKAVSFFEKAIETDPRYARAYYNLGFTYKQLGNREKAIAYLKKAVEINPRYATAAFNLAVACFENREFETAITYCDEALRLGFPVPADFLKSLEPFRKK